MAEYFRAEDGTLFEKVDGHIRPVYDETQLDSSTYIQRRLIVGASDMERTAVVLIPLPAGGEVEIDPIWRFRGWTDELTIEGPEPTRADVVEPPEGWADEDGDDDPDT